MSEMAEKFDESNLAERSKITYTNALDVLTLCHLSEKLVRKTAHSTLTGFRSVVAFEGQLYEIIVNPLYKYADEFNQ